VILAITVLFGLQGIPCLYYGTEQGLHGRGHSDQFVREALWDSHERKRLYHEATSFLKLRSERWKWVRQGGDASKPMISVPGTNSASGND